MIYRTVPLVLAAALALAGCGSGGGGETAVGTTLQQDAVQASRLAPNQGVASSLTDASPQLVSLDPDTVDVSHFQAYEITLPTAGTLTVLMQSDQFDSHLQLFDESFLADPSDDTAFIAESDDAGTTLHAMISEDLPAGRYIVLAGTAFGNVPDTGSYALMSTVTR